MARNSSKGSGESGGPLRPVRAHSPVRADEAVGQRRQVREEIGDRTARHRQSRVRDAAIDEWAPIGQDIHAD